MDALSRLAARALGVAPAVRPIIAPLFLPTPLQAEDSWPVREIAPPEPPRSITRKRTPVEVEVDAADREPDVSEQPSRSIHALNGEFTPPHEPAVLPPADLRPTNIARVPPRPSPPLNRRVERPPQEPATHEGASAERMPPPIADVETPVAVRHAPRHMQPSPMAKQRSDTARVPVVSATPLGVVSSSDDTPRQTRAALPGKVLARLGAIRESVSTAAGARRDPAPMVRVTIGRIEVRSTPAATVAPARPAARAPESRMTLADYLARKRRNGL